MENMVGKSLKTPVGRTWKIYPKAGNPEFKSISSCSMGARKTNICTRTKEATWLFGSV
jgi:hypothetical protein